MLKKDGMEQKHGERTNQEGENKRMSENQKWKKQKMEVGGGGHIHLAAGARKAQLVKVQEGHREEGAEQSWDGLVWPVLGWAGLG